MKKCMYLKARNQYGEYVTVFEVVGNTARTSDGFYHITKLFFNGKSLLTENEQLRKTDSATNVSIDTTN